MNRIASSARLIAIVAIVGLCSCSDENKTPGVRTGDDATSSQSDHGSDSGSTNDTAVETSDSLSEQDSSSQNTSPDTTSASESQGTVTHSDPTTDDSDSHSAVLDADGDGWPAGDGLDCNDSDSSINPDMNEDTTNDFDDDCDGKTDETGVVDTEGCDGQEFAIEFLPTNLMILLDMSSSMVTAPPTPTKWEQARAALVSLVTDWNNQINFGLDIFPDDGDCGVNAAVMRDVAPNNATNIINYLTNATPYGATPLCMGLRKMLETNYAPGLFAGNASSYMVVVSDGADTCGGTSGICQPESSGWLGGSEYPTTDQLAERTSDLLAIGVRTFVIGFGDGVNPDELNAIASAGGTGFDSYLDAANQTELHDALAAIASTIASCSFELKDPNASADPDKVNFFFDGTAVPFDSGCSNGNGWDWTDSTHTAIVFCDAACSQIKNGSVQNISAEFGCDQVAN